MANLMFGLVALTVDQGLKLNRIFQLSFLKTERADDGAVVGARMARSLTPTSLPRHANGPKCYPCSVSVLACCKSFPLSTIFRTSSSRSQKSEIRFSQ